MRNMRSHTITMGPLSLLCSIRGAFKRGLVHPPVSVSHSSTFTSAGQGIDYHLTHFQRFNDQMDYLTILSTQSFLLFAPKSSPHGTHAHKLLAARSKVRSEAAATDPPQTPKRKIKQLTP